MLNERPLRLVAKPSDASMAITSRVGHEVPTRVQGHEHIEHTGGQRGQICR